MAIGILAGPTPEGTGTAALTSAAFTPPDKCLVVVLVAAGWSSTNPAAVTITDSGSHSWTKGPTAAGTTSNGGLAAVWWTYFDTSPGSITVTATFSNLGTGGGTMMDVWPLTGAAKIQTGAGSGTATRAASTDGSVSVTATVLGSFILGISDGATNQQTLTVNANTSLSAQYNDTTDNVSMVSWEAKNFSFPGAITLGGTWAAAEDTNVAALEILPALYGPIQIVSSYSGYH